MAEDWYLLKSPYSQLSGFESEALEEFGLEGFDEALGSGLAEDVELYSSDLKEHTTIKAVVQGNTADTKLNAMTRNMLCKIGTSKAGMYVKYRGRYWLITGFVDNNMVYEKAILTMCNYLLTWLNSRGEIVQRWVNVTSASQYNNGETGMKFYFVRSDQLLIVTPDDDECLLLETGKRFIVDKRCQVYEKSIPSDVVVETSNPLTVYSITRMDTVLYDYQGSGHSEFMAYQDEQRDTDGYYVVDGQGYWLCEPPTQDHENDVSSATISANSDTLYIGLEPIVCTAVFEDDATPVWGIEADFDTAMLDVEYVNNSIMVSTNDDRLANKSFKVVLNADGYDATKVTIRIYDFI